MDIQISRTFVRIIIPSYRCPRLGLNFDNEVKVVERFRSNGAETFEPAGITGSNFILQKKRSVICTAKVDKIRGELSDSEKVLTDRAGLLLPIATAYEARVSDRADGERPEVNTNLSQNRVELQG